MHFGVGREPSRVATHYTQSVFRALTAATGGTTVTANYPASGAAIVFVYDYSGLTGFDVGAIFNIGGGVQGSPFISLTATTTQAVDQCFGNGFGEISGAQTFTGTNTGGPNWTVSGGQGPGTGTPGISVAGAAFVATLAARLRSDLPDRRRRYSSQAIRDSALLAASVWDGRRLEPQRGFMGRARHEAGVIYLYSEHYMGKEEPVTHIEAIKARGDWIPGVIDPASKGRSQKDGEQLIENYRRGGLRISTAFNGVEAGIYACDQLMQAGKLKAFNSLSNFYSELRMYRRDKDGEVVKERDHLMDAMKYLVLSGLDRMVTKPLPIPDAEQRSWSPGMKSNDWMM